MSEAGVQPLGVLIVDDHPMIRQMVRLACEDRPGLKVVGEARDGHEALERCRELEPAVVVLDLVLPGLDGIEVARRLRQEGSAARILILSGRDDGEAVYEALRAGVDGYQEKTAPVKEIAAAIEAVAGGTKVFTLEQQRAAFARLGKEARDARTAASAASGLTPRERQVIELLVQGLSTRQMAFRLGVSERTAEAHIANLYQKLDVRTRVQAVNRAAGLGLVRLG